MAEEKRAKPHAIMIALPYQGHITPSVNLAVKLASNGVVVTFAHLEFIHHKLSQSGDPDLFSEARQSGLDIRYTTIGDGFPLEFSRDDAYWESMFVNFEGRVDEFVGKIIESDPDLCPFLVTDTLFTWQAAIASKYKLVSVSFWTEPALVFSLAYHMELLQQNAHFPCQDHVEEEINYIPGVVSISRKDLMPYLKQGGTGNIVHKTVVKAFKEVKKADFILHNTLHDLESITLSALNKYQPNYAIGPISFSKSIATSQSLWSEADCSDWLESKPENSVIYVSFGSFVQTSKEVIEEIAKGLLLSEVYFIWVVRADTISSGDASVFPEGFEDEIKDRGLVVPWCNQIKVLSSPAVGGFLTHCGWNSILESIWCGVPMICYPLEYDQPTNRKLLVDDWRIGIDLCEGTSIDRNEVARKIKKLVSNDALKKEVKKVSGVLQKAWERDGSSKANFDQFVKELEAKLLAKTSVKKFPLTST